MTAAVDELYSLLVPLADERLIVPRACVAEVVRFSQPQDAKSPHNWYLGDVSWNGRMLPVVSFEGTMGDKIPEATGRTRIVVFYAIAGVLKGGYFGLLTQGFPQLVRVNREVLVAANDRPLPEGTPVLCRVKMINEYPFIPDLEKLETMLSAQEASTTEH